MILRIAAFIFLFANARGFLVLAQSSGIPAEKTIVWDGLLTPDIIDFDYWKSNYEGIVIDNTPLFCRPNLDPQGHNGLKHNNLWQAGNWAFLYHMIGDYQIY